MTRSTTVDVGGAVDATGSWPSQSAPAMNEFRELNCAILPRVNSDVELAPILAPRDAGAAPAATADSTEAAEAKDARKRVER